VKGSVPFAGEHERSWVGNSRICKLLPLRNVRIHA
jgi:hypothetical protein